jgi:hypothetical protein
MEAFLEEQPQCKELTGERLEIAYQQWLEDINNELTSLRREQQIMYNKQNKDDYGRSD